MGPQGRIHQTMNHYDRDAYLFRTPSLPSISSVQSVQTTPRFVDHHIGLFPLIGFSWHNIRFPFFYLRTITNNFTRL